MNAVMHYLREIAASPGEEVSDRELLCRFAEQRDQSAFTQLVRRHGAMVLGVGRRLLHNPHDAEDVFQATFLVLARKLASSTWHDSLGNYLYCVAYRLALRARAQAHRRPLADGECDTLVPADRIDPIQQQDLRALLDQELQALPRKYRMPLICHYLEGRTQAETALLLGWSPGTVSGWLAGPGTCCGSAGKIWAAGTVRRSRRLCERCTRPPARRWPCCGTGSLPQSLQTRSASPG